MVNECPSGKESQEKVFVKCDGVCRECSYVYEWAGQKKMADGVDLD